MIVAVSECKTLISIDFTIYFFVFSSTLVSTEEIQLNLGISNSLEVCQKHLATRRIFNPFSLFGNVVKQGLSCLIERFLIECRKTKTRVITLANHKGHR